MTNLPAEPQLTLRTPESLIAAVPYLLGFHPDRSVVLIVLSEGRLELVVRVDLSDVCDPHGRAELLQTLWRTPGDSVFVVGYDTGPLRHRGVLTALAFELSEALAERGGDVIDAFVVCGGGQRPVRWWFLDDPHHAHELDAPGDEAAAEAVFLGLGALADRAALGEICRGPEPEEAERLALRSAGVVAALPREADRRLGLALDLLAGADAQGEAGEDDRWLRLAVLCADDGLVDDLVGAATREGSHAGVDAWSQVVRHAPPFLQPGPLALLALNGWLSGSGALQLVCMERLAALERDYWLLGLLHHIHAEVISPREWPWVGQGVESEAV